MDASRRTAASRMSLGTRSISGIPGTSQRLVQRRRLFDVLDHGARGSVTVVSGPAGSGKTVLVSSWLAGGGWPGPVVWVAVERDERDPTRFWGAVLDGLRSSAAGAGCRVLEGLTAGPRGADKQFVRRLSEGLAALTVAVVLVLDDVHQLKSPEALDGLAALLSGGQERLRVILITRGAPRLALHRLRVAGELTEIGGEDLAFTRGEAGELLSAAGVVMSVDNVSRLNERTEGWAAGLRLAALRLARLDDRDRFVAEFSGSERTVAEYLVDEVLAGQPPEARELLLRTSVLERVNGPLARLLTGRSDAERMLQDLEDANAFVTSVDVERTWFRYHHLLLDLLYRQLRREPAKGIRALHRTAARWYAENGFAVDAIRHAEAGHDWQYARDLLVEHWFTIFLDGQQATIQALLATLPLDWVRSDAELAGLAAADRLAVGDLEGADAYLALAERLADSVPEPRRRRFEVTLAVARLTRARSGGDFEAAAEGAEAILAPAAGETWADVVSNEDLRALALMNVGYVELWALRLEDAERHLDAGVALARRIGRQHVLLGCLGPSAEVALITGRRQLAEARSREAIALAERLGRSADGVVGVAYSVLANVLNTEGKLEEGEHWLTRAAKALAGMPDPEASVVLPFGWAMLRIAQGEYEQTIVYLREVERAHERLHSPHFLTTPTTTWQLRAAIHLGDVDAARSALAQAGEAARAKPEWCNVGAHLHLAEDDPQAALDALAPVLSGPWALHDAHLQIEGLLLEAIAWERLGQAANTERAVERALDLAEPDGLVWIFLTMPAARRLLKRLLGHRTAHGPFIADLLGHFARAAPPRRERDTDEPREQLTDRELTVLRFLPTNLSAAEIADELFISVHTVSTHMRHIYTKLGVHRRSEAVERGQALDLLTHSLHTR